MPPLIKRFHLHTNVNVFKINSTFEKETPYHAAHDLNVKFFFLNH